MARAPLTFEEKRLAIICFNHCYSQWVWNISKITLQENGRAAAANVVKKHCRWFGLGTPHPTNVRVGANARGTGMVMSRDGQQVAELTWTRFVDFMEENRTCPKTAAEVDTEELMSVLEE